MISPSSRSRPLVPATPPQTCARRWSDHRGGDHRSPRSNMPTASMQIHACVPAFLVSSTTCRPHYLPAMPRQIPGRSSGNLSRPPSAMRARNVLDQCVK
jgi:hypothetical protein